ncbi:hypothetical protein [Psychrobacter sp. P11G3]|uniref:hypothetical protein n=1 Tax=Psychrobacter sp. P11G3 TaxID=1699623 RepID=UPI00070FA80E|nr:hypothetical protein [Psychrobacter sp. P11G3]KRG36371.1 hypothetical protein AK824_04280 [Psychrobacter sp. P11G3]
MTELNTSNKDHLKQDSLDKNDNQSVTQTLLNKQDTSMQENNRQQINSQQVSIKSWSQKILVVILCAASFYGGWKSYESNMVNECTANGGQMVEGQKTMICQLS